MKTNVTATSLATYDAMRAAGFCELQAKILAAMAFGKLYSRRQLATRLKLETSTVSGRVNELIETGAIEVCGTIECPISHRRVEAIKRTDEQMEMRV